MPYFTLLLIYYLLSSLHLGFASRNPPTKSPFNFRKKSDDGVVFSAPLIHYNSPNSPLYNPNHTHDEQIKYGVLDSLSRGRYFSQTNLNMTSDGYVAAHVIGKTMLMEFTIGTPPFKVYGLFDTGSSLTWVQCLPCTHCFESKQHPIFEPRRSSSYRSLHCSDAECQLAARSWDCGGYLSKNPGSCDFHTRYIDDNRSSGILSAETFTFSAEGTSTKVEDFIFGCGNDIRGNHVYSDDMMGIVGLGNHKVSLVHQLRVSHFSYHVVANVSHANGMVHFGPGSSLTDSGMTTPILTLDDGHYHLNLTGISVDGSDLSLPPGIFENGINEDGESEGFVIDTGCTYTLLRSEAFDVLKTAIIEAMYSKGEPKTAGHFEVCYTDVRGAPEVVFQFSGLDYVLCNGNLWIRVYRLYCLAILRLKESYGKVSVLGFHQQRNVQVGYDLEKQLLSLVYPGACPDDIDSLRL